MTGRPPFPVDLVLRTLVGLLGAVPAVVLVTVWDDPSSFGATLPPALGMVAPGAVLAATTSALVAALGVGRWGSGGLVGAVGAFVAHVGGVVAIHGADTVLTVLVRTPADPLFACLAIGLPCGTLAARTGIPWRRCSMPGSRPSTDRIAEDMA